MDTRTLMTVSEFEKAAARLGPCELVRGEVVTLSPGGLRHGRVASKIGGLLFQWEKHTGLGRVIACESGLVIEKDPPTVRGADVLYYSFERLPRDASLEGFSSVPPNLTIEVVGKGHAWRELVEKVGEYLRMGVDRVWVIDPRTRRVHVFQPEAEPAIMDCGQTLKDDTVLPGFACTVDELFAD